MKKSQAEVDFKSKNLSSPSGMQVIEHPYRSEVDSLIPASTCDHPFLYHLSR